ncbi:RNA polymerase recycling motor HelD [Bacillus sp. NPDC077027]|uniref:RNA polymerase recycling motor HelD n=1 Tax=Bacillus sp. NPDC077027 TaxID=3390548 RepID=UPI003D021FFF
MAKSDKSVEMLYLHYTLENVRKQKKSVNQQMTNISADILHLRKGFFDDVKINVDHPEEAAETMSSIKQQGEILSERERTQKQLAKQLKKLEKQELIPYFGRIDFLEKGALAAEQVYIGIHSLMDEKEEHFLVYDWRAPISSLYYEHTLGRAAYETEEAVIHGELTLKRQFLIKNGQLDAMFDTELTIGDEMLQTVLSGAADTQMKNIVSTIQREQNLIIREQKSPLLIVQGASGSGKTSAALQRVAYMLYTHRETLRADEIVLFTPNQLFNSYIATVLPELGEENMKQLTFQEYIEQKLDGDFRCETPFHQLEFCLKNDDLPVKQLRIRGIQYKGSLAFKQDVDRFIDHLSNEGMQFKRIKFKGRLLIEKEDILSYFYSLDLKSSIPDRLEQTKHWLHKKLDHFEKIERKRSWVTETSELLDPQVYIKVYQKLQKKRQFDQNTFDDYTREKRVIEAVIVRKAFKPLRDAIEKLEFVHMKGVYVNFLSDWSLRDAPDDWDAIFKQTKRYMVKGLMPYEDAAPYLYLQGMIKGNVQNRMIQHVLIDEVQDYSPFQLALIQAVYPKSKMTLLGDVNQSIYAHAIEQEEPILASIDGDATYFTLSKTYRSTKPIVEFTKHLLDRSEADRIEPFQRLGEKPVIQLVTNSNHYKQTLLDMFSSLEKKNVSTIAVICQTAEECRQLHAMLNQYVKLKLIHDETTPFETGVCVIPIYLAKGIEFDAVIIANGSRELYINEHDRKLLYTACTRAMHELYVCVNGEMSPFLAKIPTTCYQSFYE